MNLEEIIELLSLYRDKFPLDQVVIHTQRDVVEAIDECIDSIDEKMEKVNEGEMDASDALEEVLLTLERIVREHKPQGIDRISRVDAEGGRKVILIEG